jgi:hypothetical protein
MQHLPVSAEGAGEIGVSGEENETDLLARSAIVYQLRGGDLSVGHRAAIDHGFRCIEGDDHAVEVAKAATGLAPDRRTGQRHGDNGSHCQPD